MPRSVRLPGEGDDEFQVRAERVARIGRVLVDAALANHCIQDFIADPELSMWTEESQRRTPTVRVEYEQAIALGGIGETLCATRNKHWGDGPSIMPLDPDDVLYERHITYMFRENSLYNRRFEQRKKLKEQLGKINRSLVSRARSQKLSAFLEQLTAEQAFLIRKGLQMSPDQFWRAVRGEFIELPEKMRHVSEVLLCQLPRKKKQLMLPFVGPSKS
jgi:hypothetical protein